MDNASVIEDLNTIGYSPLDGFTKLQIVEINYWLLTRSVYRDAHVPQTARNRGEQRVSRSHADDCDRICVHTHDAILAPHIWELALSLTDVAAVYLERDPPVCYSANVFWTRPGNSAYPDIQELHEDKDDAKFLGLFAFLTDVLTPEDGPHELQGPDGVIRSIYGPAGTCFLADTSRFHRGVKPRKGERGFAWFRWGVSDRPAANIWDQIEPIDKTLLGDRYPTDPRLQESMRLLAR